MSSGEPSDPKRLKQAFLKKAISEGRGAQAIASLNRLAVNRQATHNPTDQDIMNGFETAAKGLRKNREAILECLSQTDFSREESPEIKELMLQDLAEQELTIDLLRTDGMPEEKLPKLSMALARLNAVERINGQASGEHWKEWSDSDPQIQNARRQAKLILSRQTPSLSLN